MADTPAVPSPAEAAPTPSALRRALRRVRDGSTLDTTEAAVLLAARGDDLDELYGNRPASARSSYSNYHGVRATPQVPSRSDFVRQSQQQFVLSGPPAYQDTVI